MTVRSTGHIYASDPMTSPILQMRKAKLRGGPGHGELLWLRPGIECEVGPQPSGLRSTMYLAGPR